MDLVSVITGIGMGALLGFIVGYAFRKLLGLGLLVVGFFIIGLIILVNSGIATVDFGVLEKKLAELFIWGFNTGNQALDKVFSGTPFTIGLIAGLGLGLLKSIGKPRFLSITQHHRRVMRDVEEGE